MPKRLLAKVRLATRLCSNCKHFDRVQGQAALKSEGLFVNVMRAASPDRLGRQVHTPEQAAEIRQRLDAGELLEDIRIDVARDQADGSLSTGSASGAEWKDFGACMLKHELLWDGDHCEKWS